MSSTNETNAMDELAESRYERVLTYMREKGVSFEQASEYEDRLIAAMSAGIPYAEAKKMVDARFGVR